MLLQGMKVAGVDDLMHKSLDDLYDTYIRTRKAIKDNMPSAAELMELEKKVTKAAKDLQETKISSGDYNKLSQDLSDLRQVLQKSSSFFHSVSTAVNPQQLSEIVRNLHVYLLSITAVAASTTAATITVGMNIGKVISDRTYNAIVELSGFVNVKQTSEATSSPNATTNGESNKANDVWVRYTVQVIGNSIGLSISYLMQKTSLMFGGCIMGSEYILNSFEKMVDPLLMRSNLPTLSMNASAKVAIQSSIIAFGFISQLRGTSIFGLKLFMTPFYISEACIEAYIFTNLLKKKN